MAPPTQPPVAPPVAPPTQPPSAAPPSQPPAPAPYQPPQAPPTAGPQPPQFPQPTPPQMQPPVAQPQPPTAPPTAPSTAPPTAQPPAAPPSLPPELKKALEDLAKKLAQAQQQPPYQPFMPVQPIQPPQSEQPYQSPFEPPYQPPYAPPYDFGGMEEGYPPEPFLPSVPPYQEQTGLPPSRKTGAPFQPPPYGDPVSPGLAGVPFQNKPPSQPLFGDLRSGGVAGLPLKTVADPLAPFGDLKGPPVAGVPLQPDVDSPLSRVPSAGNQPMPPMAFQPQPPMFPGAFPREEPFGEEPAFRDFILPTPFEEQIAPEPFGGLEPGPTMAPPEAPVTSAPMPLPVPMPFQPIAAPTGPTKPGGLKTIQGGPPMEPIAPIESEDFLPKSPLSGAISEIPGAIGKEPTMGLPPLGSEVPRSPFPMPEGFEEPAFFGEPTFRNQLLEPFAEEPRDTIQPTFEEEAITPRQAFPFAPQFQQPFQPQIPGQFEEQPFTPEMFAGEPFAPQPFERVPPSPLQQAAREMPPSSAKRPIVVPPEGFPFGTQGSMYVPGSTIPEGVDPLAPLEYTEEMGRAGGNALALASLIPPNAFGNMYVGDAAFGGAPISTAEYYRNVASGSVGGQGSLYEEGALEAAKEAAKNPYSGIFGENLRELVAKDPSLQPMVDAKVARDLDRIAKVEQDYEQMKPLSDLLKANKFQEAFAYAKEQGLADRLLKADWLSQLRQPFTDEEQQQFYNAIPPDLVGKGWIFDPANAMKRSFTAKGTTPQWMGYPDPGAAFVRKDDDTIKKIVGFGIDLMLAAAGVPPLTAGLTKAAYTLAETGGDIGAAVRAGAASAIGAKIGEVVRTGIPGANIPSSAANVAEKAATDAIARGIGGEALEEVVITALRPTLGSVLANTVASNAVKSALQEAPDFVRNGTEPDVEEILVRGSKIKPNLGTALASVGQGGVQDIFSERQIAEFQEAEARGEDPTQPEELEEVEVTAKRQPSPSLVAPVVSGALTEAFKPSPPDGLEEVTVTAKKPEKQRLTVPAPSGLESVDAFEPAPIGESGMQEIPVEGEKPPERGSVFVPSPEMLDVKPEDILKDYKPTEVKQSKLKSLLDKVGGIKNLLRLLSAIQAARSGRQAPSIGGGALPRGDGMAGALPKYTFQRKALRPDIDYYTYGTRPEVPFFEDTITGPDSGPATGILPPKDRPPVFAMGGLAEGGMSDESESRYVEGPGSGREDKIPALLSDGEYVIDAETLALLGDGSTKEGARRMDDFRAKIRQHKGRALSRGQISPNAKSPEKYMGGGLT